MPGHQSVLLHLPQTGPVLLAIDAVPAVSMLDPETRLVFPGNDEDEAKTRASTRKLVEAARREGVALIISFEEHESGFSRLRSIKTDVPPTESTPAISFRSLPT
jgi:N-acyl homoserine lactone hydrolase